MDQEIAVIHENMVNGNRRSAIVGINEYGNDFFSEYARYLQETYCHETSEYHYFKDAVLSYFRIKGR